MSLDIEQFTIIVYREVVENRKIRYQIMPPDEIKLMSAIYFWEKTDPDCSKY